MYGVIQQNYVIFISTGFEKKTNQVKMASFVGHADSGKAKIIIIISVNIFDASICLWLLQLIACIAISSYTKQKEI